MRQHQLLELGDIVQSLSYFSGIGFPKTSVVLDIGTRFGSLVKAFADHGYTNVYGIDTDESSINHGREIYPELRYRLYSYGGKIIPFDDESFDVVSMFDVLEHIANLPGYLGEVRRILRQHGILVFQTPNRYVNIPWEILQHRSLTRWRIYHCSLQTLDSLHCLLGKSGFNEITVQKFGIRSEFRINLAREKIGLIGPALLSLADHMPLVCAPNFWGHARKNSQRTAGSKNLSDV